MHSPKTPDILWSSLISLFSWVTRVPSVPLTPFVPSSPSLLQETHQAEPDALGDGWHWVLSAAEKVILVQQDETTQEISSLRKLSGTVRSRPTLQNRIHSLWNQLDPETMTHVVASRLEANLRNALFRDLIASHQASWFQLIRQVLLRRRAHQEMVTVSSSLHEETQKMITTLRSEWEEDKYSKNILGNLKVSCLQASGITEKHGMSPKALVDILWTISMCLSRTLTTDSIIHPEENLMILTTVCEMVPTLMRLWSKTHLMSSRVKEKIGRLPSQWSLEKRPVLIISARYVDGSLTTPSMPTETFEQCRCRLAELLRSRTSPISTTPIARTKSENFKDNRVQLEKLLVFKSPVKIKLD